MYTAQNLAVDQIKCALLCCSTTFSFALEASRIGPFMLMRMKRCKLLMDMSTGMAQRMGQRALLCNQQEHRKHPPQGDGAQRRAEQA